MEGNKSKTHTHNENIKHENSTKKPLVHPRSNWGRSLCESTVLSIHAMWNYAQWLSQGNIKLIEARNKQLIPKSMIENIFRQLWGKQIEKEKGDEKELNSCLKKD